MFLIHNFIKGLFPLCFYFTDDGAGGGGGNGDGDKGGSGGEGDKGGDKKLAGKYESSKALEKAYIELEANQGKTTESHKKDKAELESLRAEKTDRSRKEREKGEQVSGKAQKALDDFDAKNDSDSLSGAEYRRWHTDRTRLVMAVERERADIEKASLKETTSEASKEALRDFLERDGEFLRKNVKDYSEKELKELAEWGEGKGCATYSEAHFCRLAEGLAKENEDLKKAKEDLDKKIEKNERRQPGFRTKEGDEGDKDKTPVFSNRRQYRRQRINAAKRDDKLLKSHEAMVAEQKK